MKCELFILFGRLCYEGHVFLNFIIVWLSVFPGHLSLLVIIILKRLDKFCVVEQ